MLFIANMAYKPIKNRRRLRRAVPKPKAVTKPKRKSKSGQAAKQTGYKPKRKTTRNKLQHEAPPPSTTNWKDIVINGANTMCSNYPPCAQVRDTTMAAMKVYQQARDTYSKYSNHFL